jgi:ATP-dependent helicase/DNAse subunit B
LSTTIHSYQNDDCEYSHLPYKKFQQVYKYKNGDSDKLLTQRKAPTVDNLVGHQACHVQHQYEGISANNITICPYTYKKKVVPRYL